MTSLIAAARRSIVVGIATTRVAHRIRLNESSTKSTNMAAGYGRAIARQTDMDESVRAARRNWRIVCHMNSIKALFQKEWCSTINAEIAHASIPITCDRSPWDKIITWEKLCVAYSHGEASRTRLPTDKIKPDMFIEPPAKPEQEAMEI